MRRRLLFGTLVFVIGMTLATGVYANHAQFYVLDGFGGVHAGGGAPVITPGTPYFGFDIAKDIAFVAQATGVSVGDSVLVLDGFGGVHEGGALAADPVSPKTPYFGFDIARAIVYRNIPPRVAAASATTFADLTDDLVHSIASTSVYAPDDGFLVVTAQVQVNCPSLAAGDLVGQIGLNIDTTTAIDTDFDGHLVTIRDCDDLVAVNWFPAQNFSPTKTYPVSAGSHTVHLLAQRYSQSGTNPLRYLDTKITAVFVDQDPSGLSEPEAAVPASSGAGVGR